jgi:hypothetical protein
MRIYLDVCCLNRPHDDLSIDRNRLEAEAVLEILRHVRSGTWQMVGSEAVDAEIALTPSPERRLKTTALSQLRSDSVVAGHTERSRAMELLALGFRYMDALHLACAESGHCDVLLSTDKSFVARSQSHKDRIMVPVANPLQWISEVNVP